MLKALHHMNVSFQWRNMITSEVPYLIDPELLRRLMQRTGTGRKINIRELADASGVSNGTIGGLLNGVQKTLPESKARRVAAVIGVDLGILFIPCERAGRSFIPQQPGREPVAV
jgi:transcriptional regulator with XRE-family HTH domain